LKNIISIIIISIAINSISSFSQDTVKSAGSEVKSILKYQFTSVKFIGNDYREICLKQDIKSAGLYDLSNFTAPITKFDNFNYDLLNLTFNNEENKFSTFKIIEMKIKLISIEL